MRFVLLLYGLYPLFALGLFVVIIWPKRDDSDHVRRMADAYARGGVAAEAPKGAGAVGARRSRRSTAPAGLACELLAG